MDAWPAEAIFVGLWAPTFLNLGLYFKQLRPSRGS
jgi:hypothetical protein